MRDLLKEVGVNDTDTKAKHVIFRSVDGIDVSIPVQKALNNYGDVLLAWEMNGEEIPPDHGYPLRIM